MEFSEFRIKSWVMEGQAPRPGTFHAEKINSNFSDEKVLWIGVFTPDEYPEEAGRISLTEDALQACRIS
jgi:hypothetical protein